MWYLWVLRLWREMWALGGERGARMEVPRLKSFERLWGGGEGRSSWVPEGNAMRWPGRIRAWTLGTTWPDGSWCLPSPSLWGGTGFSPPVG